MSEGDSGESERKEAQTATDGDRDQPSSGDPTGERRSDKQRDPGDGRTEGTPRQRGQRQGNGGQRDDPTQGTHRDSRRQGTGGTGQRQAEDDRQGHAQDRSGPQRRAEGTSLDPNIAAALSYLLGWVTGVVFLVIEKRDEFVRFHAAQSIAIFGGLTVLWFVFSTLFASLLVTPGSFTVVRLGQLIQLVGFVAWLLLMYMAYDGRWFRVPIAADIADSILDEMGPSGRSRQSHHPPRDPHPSTQSPSSGQRQQGAQPRRSDQPQSGEQSPSDGQPASDGYQ